MNYELYKRVVRSINNSMYHGYIRDGELTSDVIEDFVDNTAEYHDEQNDFVEPRWGRDAEETLARVCNHFNVMYHNN